MMTNQSCQTLHNGRIRRRRRLIHISNTQSAAALSTTAVIWMFFHAVAVVVVIVEASSTSSTSSTTVPIVKTGTENSDQWTVVASQQQQPPPPPPPSQAQKQQYGLQTARLPPPPPPRQILAQQMIDDHYSDRSSSSWSLDTVTKTNPSTEMKHDNEQTQRNVEPLPSDDSNDPRRKEEHESQVLRPPLPPPPSSRMIQKIVPIGANQEEDKESDEALSSLEESASIASRYSSEKLADPISMKGNSPHEQNQPPYDHQSDLPTPQSRVFAGMIQNSDISSSSNQQRLYEEIKSSMLLTDPSKTLHQQQPSIIARSDELIAQNTQRQPNPLGATNGMTNEVPPPLAKRTLDRPYSVGQSLRQQERQQHHRQYQQLMTAQSVPYQSRSSSAAGTTQQQQQQQWHYEQQQRRQQGRQQPVHGTTWRRWWRHIEQGLDGLSDLEETVSAQARNLVTSAISQTATVATALTRPLTDRKVYDDSHDDLPSHLTIQTTMISPTSTKKLKPYLNQPTPQLDLSRFQRVLSPRAESTNGSPKPMSHAVDSTIVGSQPDKGSNQSNEMSIESSRHIDWTRLQPTRRMIRANGGASEPLHAQQGPTWITPDQQQQRPPPPPPPVTASEPPAAATITQPVSNNPYAAALLNPPRKGPMQSSDRRTPAWSSIPGEPNSALPQRGRVRGDFDDDDDTSKSFSRRIVQSFSGLSSLVPRISLRFWRSDDADDSVSMATLDAWDARQKHDDAADSSASRNKGGLWGLLPSADSTNIATIVSSAKADRWLPSSTTASKARMTAPLADIMARCEDGRSAGLLTRIDRDKCISIGNSMALWDVMTLSLVLATARIMMSKGDVPFPFSRQEFLHVSLPAIISTFESAMDSWAPYALSAALLTSWTRDLVLRGHTGSLLTSVSSVVEEEAKYGALFLRLFSAVPTSKRIQDRMVAAARAQIIAKVNTARLQSFVSLVLMSLVLSTFSALQPLLGALLDAAKKLIALEHFRTWPPVWADLLLETKSICMALVDSVGAVLRSELSAVLSNPLRYSFEASIFVALAIVSILPSLEQRKNGVAHPDDEEEEDALEISDRMTEHVSNLGKSSATRLALLSDSSGIDGALERWRTVIPRDVDPKSDISVQSVIRLGGYSILTAFLLVIPLFIYGRFADTPFTPTPNRIVRWDSLVDVGIVLLCTQQLTWSAFLSKVFSTEAQKKVIGFLALLTGAINSRLKVLHSTPSNLHLQASISPTAGLAVKDLWAAHATRRAWAVRGANFQCRNGEVVAIIGDDSAGKTRLMTTLVEAVLLPPRSAQTSTRVRGSVSIGGLEASKWDSRQIRRRIGILLNDVRSQSDFAQVLSGLTLEEILEPSGGIRNFKISHNPGPSERAATMLALKITDLYSTLLPNLPSKLSTILTATEDDMRPSAVRPRYHVLSPSEWSKLLLARIISQAIHDNDNALASTENVDKCLVGSVLLLDDACQQLSEIEEARLLRQLRQTGAATVIASNRWALGRLADRIVVLKDGAVVESGTHGELLSRGPQQSLYATKWLALTTQF